MNQFVKKISVSIMIICLIYEFLVKFHVSYFISYAILIVIYCLLLDNGKTHGIYF